MKKLMMDYDALIDAALATFQGIQIERVVLKVWHCST
jgi:hypothetical protein